MCLSRAKVLSRDVPRRSERRCPESARLLPRSSSRPAARSLPLVSISRICCAPCRPRFGLRRVHASPITTPHHSPVLSPGHQFLTRSSSTVAETGFQGKLFMFSRKIISRFCIYYYILYPFTINIKKAYVSNIPLKPYSSGLPYIYT